MKVLLLLCVQLFRSVLKLLFLLDQSDDETPQGSPSEVAGNQDESTAAKQQSNGQSVEVEQSSRTHDHEDELGRGEGPDPLINPLLLAKLNTQVSGFF